jgi:hypothetical protein
MYPTRGTRIHPKGLQSPLEGGPPHRETERIKAPFAGTICSTFFSKPLLFEHGRVAPSIKFVEGAHCELRLNGVLRRVMCNELDQQVRQVAQRSAEEVVHPLSARVRRDLGGQTRKQPSQRLGPMALQSEEVLELADETPSDDLALGRGPAPIRPSITLGGNRCWGWQQQAPRIAPSNGAPTLAP